MSVTTTHIGDVPAPVQDAEAKAEQAAPAAVRPEIDLIEQEFNAIAERAVKNAPSEKDAAQKVPEVAKLAEDVKDALEHKTGRSGAVTLGADAVGSVRAVKAGYKTTEFWGAVAVFALTFTGTVHIPGKYGDAITQAAVGLSYILSRGLVKLGASKA